MGMNTYHTLDQLLKLPRGKLESNFLFHRACYITMCIVLNVNVVLIPHRAHWYC